MNQEQTLAVRKRDGVAEHDKHMGRAQQSPMALSLPQSISHAGALGRSVSLAQLIATWANASSEKLIQTSLTTEDCDNIERFSSRLHGLAAAYYANRITGADGQTDLRRALLKAATPRICAMSERRYASTAKGRLTELVFLHGATRQFHSAAYLREPSRCDVMDPQHHGQLVVSPHEMNALVRQALQAQRVPGADFDRIAPLLDRRDAPLGTLLHEAFRNTAEHAYLSLDGRVPHRGLRCILIAVRSVNPQELHPRVLVCAEHPELESYCASLRGYAAQGNRRLVHFIELSVLDTGPGFMATIANRVQSGIGDAEKVAECFEDHVSSKRGPNSGLGLGRILRRINKLDGFLRIRTSSTEAVFSSGWQNSDTKPTPHVVGGLPTAIGTALTMAVPLRA